MGGFGIPVTRVFLCDDQPELVVRLQEALSDEFDIVGVAGSGESLLAEAPGVSPDVIVLDVSLPGMNGIEAAERVKKILPRVKVVMLSMHTLDVYAAAALEAGASAYVVKTWGVFELARAIRNVHNGVEYSPPGHSNGK